MLRFATILLGLVVSGCSTAAMPAIAQEAAPDPTRTLDVSARAAVVRAPDRAVVRLAVATTAETARAAMRGNAESMTTVLGALDEVGIERAAVQTQGLALRPRYERGPNTQRTVVGYEAVNQVTVRVDEVDRVGRVVDAAVTAGSNRVTGIRFELSDPESAYLEALQRAIAQARREAEAAARALDETLGPPIDVSTEGLDAPASRGPTPDAMELRSSSTPVEPGEMEVRAAVRITYRLGS